MIKKYSLAYITDYGISFAPAYFATIQAAKGYARVMGYKCFKVEDERHVRYVSLSGKNLSRKHFTSELLKYHGFNWVSTNYPHIPLSEEA